jgi:periplasmic divalent cation tolerance protein
MDTFSNSLLYLLNGPFPSRMKFLRGSLVGKHMDEFKIALCTCADHAEAVRIARHLVEQRLAACVNILPAVQSIYRWQGAVESATEVLLVIKTESARIHEAQLAVERHHSYEVPEFLVLPVAGGSEAYLGWLRTCLQ